MSTFAIAAGLAALSLIAAPALAQTAPDPQRLALARQIFEVQGGATSAAAAIRGMQKSMAESLPTPEARQRMAEAMDSMVTAVLPRLYDELASFYASDFTEGQLKDILSFYKSPTGQAM